MNKQATGTITNNAKKTPFMLYLVDTLRNIKQEEVEFARCMIDDLAVMYDSTEIDKALRHLLYDYGINYTEQETKFRILTDYLSRLDNRLQEVLEGMEGQFKAIQGVADNG